MDYQRSQGENGVKAKPAMSDLEARELPVPKAGSEVSKGEEENWQKKV